MNDSLMGKIALVTGGGRGIGAAIALKLASLGATIIVCGRTLARLQHTAGQIRSAGGQSEPLSCDVADWNSVAALAGKVKASYGRLDILVNNAGIGVQSGPLHTLPVEKWDPVFNTNLRGVFYMIRAFAPILIASGGGDIVNISSLAGKNSLPNSAAYAASKWGLNGLTYSVAEELREHNIRVSVVCPGSTHTEFSPHEGKSTDTMLAPEDIAHAVTMLVTSRKQAFVSEINIRPTRKS
ncbi:MAG TPA: SDR family NAD(P)-dependent oxidoreductase [Candidatus Angelobacter sp.]|jgi:NAD(P)-dependent dehydrogenase (short-subunit alcohol dehydrogenase family)